MYGFIWDFMKDAGSFTGYRVKMLIDGPQANIRVFDVTEQVFNMQNDPVYKFPLIGEYLFYITQDKNGVVTELFDAMKGHCNAVYTFGSPRRIASVLKFEKAYIEFTDLAQQFAEGRLVYYHNYRKLNAKELKKGTKLPLSKKVSVYCLDWTKKETTFSRVDLDFVKSILNDNVYWITLYNFSSENEIVDCITVTRNFKKDENEKIGDLAKLHLSREQLTSPQK
jgi:hypothetical protein